VGDSVTQGQTLLTISPLESRVLDPRSRAEAEARVAARASALQAARQEADAARATADFYTAEVKRLRPLAEKGVLSREALDRAEMQMLTADAALRSAIHAVDVARYELDAAQTALKYSAGTIMDEPAERVPVRSPITGRILKIARECEGPVRTGEALLEVGDPALLEVEVDVLSADAVKIKPGMPVLFDRWGGERPLDGRVRTIEPVGFTKISALGVEEQRVLIIADFTSPPEAWQRLGDGYRVEAHFVLWHDDNVLQVPAGSLFRYNNGWAVFVAEDGRARRRPVEVGQRNGLIAQILAGVKEGETVINHPSDEVEDGKAVKPK
jgi:HlyD family secretion protein